MDPSSSPAMRVMVANKPGAIGSKLALEVYGLRRWFGNFQAIKNSWFSVDESSLFCLLGPNGAGKSTTINCLTGSLFVVSCCCFPCLLYCCCCFFLHCYQYFWLLPLLLLLLLFL